MGFLPEETNKRQNSLGQVQIKEVPMENQLNEPKEITVTDFSDFKTTPLRLVGKDGMVYWKDCPSVTLAREKEDHGKMINLRTGEMRLAKDYVLILIGDGGLGKQ